jgi:tetratricopeptide (TPR) repeat protein
MKLARCYTYDSMQDFDKAEKLFQQAITTWESRIARYRAGEPVKPNIFPYIHGGCEEAERSIGIVFMEMGQMYQAAGNYVKALEMVDAFARGLEERGDTESNNYTYAYENRGKAYLGLARECDDPEKRGQYLALALEMMSQALERNLRKRGEVAMDSIDCQEYLGDIYTEMGDFGEAANAYMAAAEMLKRLFGEDYGRLAVIREKMRFGQ